MKKLIKMEIITEPTKIEKSSVECDGCGLPASLNADGLCSHCKVCPRGRVSGPTIGERITNFKLRITNWLGRSGDAEPLTTIK